MARIRTIKPEFFTSEDICSLTPLSRLFYVSLWCESDRVGRLAWKPNTFKLRYFPGDECNIHAMGAELVAANLIVLYEVDGKQYAEIPTFETHQVINNREAESSIPAKPAAENPRVKVASGRVQAEGRKEGKGKERKEGNGSLTTGFDEFWNAWPKNERKQDKGKCLEKWTARNLDELKDRILSDIDVKKRTQKWQAGYIEAPEVYLNNSRWEDGVEPEDAAVIASRTPSKIESFAERDARIGREKWEAQTGRIHPDNLKNNPQHSDYVVDVATLELPQ